jgi:hypothetical protein
MAQKLVFGRVTYYAYRSCSSTTQLTVLTCNSCTRMQDVFCTFFFRLSMCFLEKVVFTLDKSHEELRNRETKIIIFLS